jgi:hypothetical protein
MPLDLWGLPVAGINHSSVTGHERSEYRCQCPHRGGCDGKIPITATDGMFVCTTTGHSFAAEQFMEWWFSGHHYPTARNDPGAEWRPGRIASGSEGCSLNYATSSSIFMTASFMSTDMT